MLRRDLGVTYKITLENLYVCCKDMHASVQVVDARRMQFGHVLRRGESDETKQTALWKKGEAKSEERK